MYTVFFDVNVSSQTPTIELSQGYILIGRIGKGDLWYSAWYVRVISMVCPTFGKLVGSLCLRLPIASATPMGAIGAGRMS
jgi:hypothetical protein